MEKEDFAGDHEVVIEIHSAKDDWGRCQFTARWLDDNEWRGGSGVHGQVFFANIDEFVSRALAGERWTEVRYLDGVRSK